MMISIEGTFFLGHPVYQRSSLVFKTFYSSNVRDDTNITTTETSIREIVTHAAINNV
jgi:hypothetical protein